MDTPIKSTIINFIQYAKNELQKDSSIKRFMELRYDIMPRVCPHEVFSVNQGTPDFFDITWEYITKIRLWPKKEEIKSEYIQNYFNWIKLAQQESQLCS